MNAPQQTTALFDHLVGAGKQRGRDVEAKLFCDLQVDDQLKLRWSLNRQITWSRAAKNSIHVSGCLPKCIDLIDSIGSKSATCYKKSKWKDSWAFVTTGSLDD